jgi:hypothetical protein
LRAAVNLQLGYLRPAGENDTLPLRVGIGLDAGEAVPVEGGFRGSALNMAARLCSAAGPGEILTTETVTHLAGTLADLRYEPRTLTNLKGMDEPVRASLVTSEELQRVMPALPAPVERPPATRVPFLEEMQSADWSGFGSQISSLIQGHLDAVNEEVKRELGDELTALHEESRLPRRHAGAGLPGSLPPSAPIIPAREPGPAPGRPPSRSWLVPALVIAAVIIVVIVLLLVLR